MNSTALRRQQVWAGDAVLSPPSQYDFPSPSSIYPSGMGASSPSFFPMAYQISPRFGASAFIPPPDVFVDGRREMGAPENRGYAPRGLTERSPDVPITDPVAMHLLVETAIADSQNFDVLTVEEVEALKQEQKTLDARLATVRKKLESETKIRDATRSLSRLALKQESRHTRGTGNKGSQDQKSHRGLEASNKKVEDLIRELLETESRMRMIDMRLLMHTAAVLQLTHKGPKKRYDNSRMSDDGYRRPDSPASPDIYDISRINGARGDDYFDERSFYRSPENLDTVMSVLQSGILQHSEPDEGHSETINKTAKRLEDMNEKIRSLLVLANPDRAADFAPPPPTTPNSATDRSAIHRQLEFLDEGIRNISSEHANLRNRPRHSLSEFQGRLQGINNQLYAVLISASSVDDTEETAPPPPVTEGDSTEQLNYMEKAFYNIERTQYALKQQIDNVKPRAQNNDKSDMAEQYETTLMGLWQIIQAGEEEARERKRERRRLLAEDPEADEQMSPDEDYNANENFSLPAFSAKVQWLFSRATSLKDKQSVLMRQIKQQRELNSKSDAQKEEEFERLNQQVLSARSEKKFMENELERAMGQLQQFDEQTTESEMAALQERNAGLEAQLVNVQERTVAIEAELNNAKELATAYESQFKDAQQLAVTFQEQLRDTEERSQALEREMKDNQQHNSTSNVQAREAEERSVSYEAQIRDAQERAIALENKLKQTQAELTKSAEKIDGIMNAMKQVTLEKEAAEARCLENTNALNAKEDDFRNLEGEIVRLTTELTFAKAELDGAYGTRAQRAADSAANPAIKKELDEMSEKNQAIMDELTALRKVQDAASQSEAEARQSERNLKAELSGMASEYEALTRDAIQNEKDRDVLESQIDRLRGEKEALERELSDEKVKWLGVRSPSTPNGGGGLDMGATSIRMLREDFRKMMKDRTAEGLKALRTEQEERRRLEALVRQLRKDANPRSNLSKTATIQ